MASTNTYGPVKAPPPRGRDDELELIAIRRFRAIEHLDSPRMANKMLRDSIAPAAPGLFTEAAKMPMNKVLLLCS